MSPFRKITYNDCEEGDNGSMFLYLCVSNIKNDVGGFHRSDFLRHRPREIACIHLLDAWFRQPGNRQLNIPFDITLSK